MDKIDVQIISLLQENARMPLKQLASKVFLSSPATAARIEKLENEGIISKYTANINLEKLGYLIIAFINIDLPPEEKPSFYPYIQQHPNVLECNCVTGRYSHLIKVAFKSTQTLDQFINELQRFGKTETQVVFSTPQQPRELKLE